jgi:hypothetical protein
MSEKSIPSRSTEAGANILQGRGGQAIIQDVVGNILLTTQNKTGSDQQILSVNDSISSIALLSGETPTSIDTKIEFPSDNFNTINWEQTPIGRVQVIQPIYNVSSSASLNLAVDVLPTSSISQSVVQQEESTITPIEEQLLFLPDNETQVYTVLTDENIKETVLPTDESVTIAVSPFEYYGSAEGAVVATNIKYDGAKVITSERDIYIDGVGYQNQPNGWTCLVTSTVIIFDYERNKGTNKNYDLSWKDFPNLTASGGEGKFLKGKTFQSGAVTATYPNFVQAARGSIPNPFESYKTFFRKVKKPIIIRVAGTGQRNRGHFVVMVGITKDGSIIVHDPANKSVAFRDQPFGKSRMLKVGEAENNINYQIFRIK